MLLWDSMVVAMRVGNKLLYEDLLYRWQQCYPDLVGPRRVAHGD